MDDLHRRARAFAVSLLSGRNEFHHSQHSSITKNHQRYLRGVMLLYVITWEIFERSQYHRQNPYELQVIRYYKKNVEIIQLDGVRW